MLATSWIFKICDRIRQAACRRSGVMKSFREKILRKGRGHVFAKNNGT
jgi:hypothetical protein